ncbi:hypothetical protein EAVNVB490_00397 [Elizabethkingia anophelis]|uniref:nucleotidyltransferase family protein n=1 Tax=Elizabethkingia anophelis TaxID=1117645 RepID=UPI0024E211F3|nr:sugar phosphate nucleotidyltransferase [Elizabethkingia anophelis]CAH1144308.1 hypothetical protein EAVNVB490_01766 [Elizabethkingia anophelis]CAI9673036.1 hypothetical protein EAVNVB490_00397 [Elizabethkingia anophelis]
MTTTKTNATLLVLAGGLGSRYKGKKQVDPMGPSGECLMEYSIYDAKNAGFDQLVLIINDYFNQETKDHFQAIADKAGIKLDFVIQALDTLLPEKHKNRLENRVKPWGTGHAILTAKDVIKNPFVVINADDYYTRKAFEKAYQLINSGQINEHQYGMVAYPLSATLSDNGSVSRGVCTTENGLLKKVVEHTNISEENGKIIHTDDAGNKTELAPDTQVSMNFWILDTSVFQVLEAEFDQFLTNLSSEKAELFIPFVIDDMIHNEGLKVVVESSQDKWFGVTYPEDKDFVIKSVQEMVDNGYYPASLW